MAPSRDQCGVAQFLSATTDKMYICRGALILWAGPGRTQIREWVWNSAFDVESNIVDQYVSHLRRKIDRPFGRRDIETVRGAGYRLRLLES